MSSELRYDVADRVATLTLNRPRQKNAFTPGMLDAWVQALRDADADPQVGAIVLTGAGDAFCAGVDLDALVAVGSSPLAKKAFLADRVHQVARAVAALDKPLIAAVNGVAVGAGLDMALMCDMRFASRSARMAEAYIKLGLVPGDGGCFYLPRLVGPAKALELLLSGEFVDSAEALRIGMVNRVYADDQLATATHDFAARLAQHSPVAMGMIKRATYESATTSMAASLDLISSHFALLTLQDPRASESPTGG